MSSPAHEISLYLALNGVGIIGAPNGWSLAVSREPESPNDTITLYDTGGAEPDTSELDIFRETVQVRVRAFDYLTARAKQSQIKNLLTLSAPLISGASRYAAIIMTSDIAAIGRDDNDRHILTANYRVIREAS